MNAPLHDVAAAVVIIGILLVGCVVGIVAIIIIIIGVVEAVPYSGGKRGQW
jgi:hypothetical protein